MLKLKFKISNRRNFSANLPIVFIYFYFVKRNLNPNTRRTGADTGGGDFVLVAHPRSFERTNQMGTNIGKSPISDNL